MLRRVARASRAFPTLIWTAAVVVLLACRKQDDPRQSMRAGANFERGDVVIVERTAAEFFEGRVLSIASTGLKIQTTDEGEPLVVAPSDAYRLQGTPRESAPGAPAICNDRPTHWAACRIAAKDGPNVVALLSSGAEVSIPSNRALQPSAVTALNVKKLFEIGESKRRFDEAAAGAGHPQRPSGWIPEVREPVIARRGPNWFSAHVASMLEDGGVRVLFEGTDRAESLPASHVVPMPPYTRSFSRGDFALTRPRSATEPWARVRVEAIGPEEAVVVGDDGERRRYEARQLVPVVPR
jgi:hypothetical protein